MTRWHKVGENTYTYTCPVLGLEMINISIWDSEDENEGKWFVMYVFPLTENEFFPGGCMPERVMSLTQNRLQVKLLEAAKAVIPVEPLQHIDW